MKGNITKSVEIIYFTYNNYIKYQSKKEINEEY